MADSTNLGLLASALIALIAGLLIHSFIIGVNVSDWWRGRSVTPVDLIVTSLGITRIGAQLANALYLISARFLPDNLDSYIAIFIIDAFYTFFIYTNMWLTSLLSIVLCLKISNLHTRLFLYLRRMISHRTGHLIVGSLLLSVINVPLWLMINEFIDGGTFNTTMENDSTDFHYFYYYTIGDVFPLLLHCISSVLLFFSLYHHTTRMKRSSNLSINLETYYSAMKLVSISFLYNTVFFTGHFVCVFYYYYYSVNLTWLYIVVDFLPALHSSYLIYTTNKLNNQMSKVLQNIMDFLYQTKGTETGEMKEATAQ